MKQGSCQVPIEKNSKEIRGLLKKISEENKKLIHEIKSLEIKDKSLTHLSDEIEKELSKKCHELEKNQDIIAELQEQLLKMELAQNEKYWKGNLIRFPMNSTVRSEITETPYDVIPTYLKEGFFPYGRLTLERMSRRTKEEFPAKHFKSREKSNSQKSSKISEDNSEENKNYLLVIDFIKQSNDLLKEALVHFGHSKESQQKVGILQQAIAILSSAETPQNKLQNFYKKIEDNRNLFKKRFNLGSEIKKSLIFSTCLNPEESKQNSQEFFEAYRKLFQENSNKEQNFLDAIDAEKVTQSLKIQ